jgi:uncharacterized protein
MTVPDQLRALAAGSLHRLVLAGPAGAMEVTVDVPTIMRGIVVIGHPHPLLGGSASHKIPQILARGLQASGWFAVRPNFRGVAGSTGAHDEGRGESSDMVWLVSQLRDALPDKPLALVGFSFGAFVMSTVAHHLLEKGVPADAVALAGTPVGVVGGGRLYAPPPFVPGTLLVHGQRDAQAPLQPLMDWCARQEQAVTVVPEADHFFSGRLTLLRSLIVSYLDRIDQAVR